jgi:sucrose-6-phosphate hydrolase SacC (GH32 family)
MREPASLDNFTGDSYEIEAEIDLNGAGEAGFLVRKGAGNQTVIGVRPSEIFVDRTRSGKVDFHKTFPGVHSMPVRTNRIRVFVDRSSVEVFADGRTITDRVFPAAESTAVETYSKGGRVRFRSVKLWRLR